jgi:hypothetical protein
MSTMMDRTGLKFAENLYAELGVSGRPAPKPARGH